MRGEKLIAVISDAASTGYVTNIIILCNIYDEVNYAIYHMKYDTLYN